ncbi:hypothetical protein MASR2M15_13880 [Anaerolineales bacterium]
MSKRQKTSQTSSRNTRKTKAETRTELRTWIMLVLSAGVISLLSRTYPVPNFILPLTGTVILMGAGIYQWKKGWNVNPVTWITSFVLFLFTLYSIFLQPGINLNTLVLIAYIIVIAMGILTKDT